MRPFTLSAVSGLATSMVVLLSGCGTLAPTSTSHPVGVVRSTPRVSSGAATTTTSTTTTLPVAPLSWSSCYSDLQCATISVPLDYSNPGGPTIGIALARHLASDPAQRVGSLVINPGGPGGSGIDDLPNELSVLTPQLLAHFDIVSFDPRGVGRSDPVTCGQRQSNVPGPQGDPVPQSPSAISSYIAGLRSYAAACESADGPLLPNIGTVDVAMDLERIRIALGDPKLTFIGHSYGTLLGATYAELFPTKVRAMVLDGAIDPSLSLDQMTAAQATGFEGAFNQFSSWCESTRCPWNEQGDATSSVLSLVSRARSAPIGAGGGRSAGPGEIYNALLDGLYSRSDWPELGQALALAEAGNGSGVLSMSDSYLTSNSSNAEAAAEAITCADHPVPPGTARYEALAEAAGQSAPIFGPPLAWGEALCSLWPVPASRQPHPIVAKGSPPILVIGTTGDPATPYPWAVSLAHQLSRGVLLTRVGEDHVAYYYSACVRAAVDRYLLFGSLPPAPATCYS